MFDGEEYSASLSAEEEPLISSINPRKKNKNKNKRRFSDEQIKSLESMFESETRLEPRKKIQLAKELGLQPRQVAIWFQNKRARWKSKQLERDYSILRANYNSLASRFEALKKEKQALAIQLQKMNDLIQKPIKEEEKGTKCESEEKARSSGHGLGVVSDEDSSINKVEEYFGLEEAEPNNLISMVETGDGSLTSQEDWGSLDSDGLFDQSNSCQWWDFWA